MKYLPVQLDLDACKGLCDEGELLVDVIGVSRLPSTVYNLRELFFHMECKEWYSYEPRLYKPRLFRTQLDIVEKSRFSSKGDSVQLQISSWAKTKFICHISRCFEFHRSPEHELRQCLLGTELGNLEIDLSLLEPHKPTEFVTTSDNDAGSVKIQLTFRPVHPQLLRQKP